MKNCKKCGKTLVPVGEARMNGKSHEDWANRQYHKKCWKEVSKEKRNEVLNKSGNCFVLDGEELEVFNGNSKKYYPLNVNDIEFLDDD